MKKIHISTQNTKVKVTDIFRYNGFNEKYSKKGKNKVHVSAQVLRRSDV